MIVNRLKSLPPKINHIKQKLSSPKAAVKLLPAKSSEAAVWSKLPVVLTAALLASSCTSLAPVGVTDSTDSNTPAYPSGYGVPVTERTLSQRLLDRSIEHTASVNIKALDPNLANNSRISIDSFYSEVLLTGEVPDEQTKSQIVALVRSMPDVRQVYDELQVAANRGYSASLQDGYITSKVLAKILANQGIKSSQVKAVTNNGVVYIMGRMTPTQQSHLVDIANKTVGITELVLLTTLVDDNGAVINSQDVMQEPNLEAPARGTLLSSQSTTDSSAVIRSSEPVTITSNPATAPVQAPPAPSQPVAGPIDNPASGSSYIELYQDQVNNSYP